MRQVALACLVFAAWAAPAPAQVSLSPGTPRGLAFSGSGHTVYGDWRAEVVTNADRWRPAQAVEIVANIRFSDAHLSGLVAAGIKADKLCLLVTAERTFDADGWMRLASDERMSTLLTPTGLAIEGGVQGAVTSRFGYAFNSPLDQLATLPVGQAVSNNDGTKTAVLSVESTLPMDLPPGLYRLRLDIGVMAGTRFYNFNGFGFAQRPSSDQAGTSTYLYSPLIPASGTHASGRAVNAATIQARIPWLLLAGYNSNGYRGVIADEDREHFATSDRSLIPDEVVLPMYDDAGTRLSYSLEPQFPADGIDPLQNIAWNWSSGQLSVRIVDPAGGQVDLGTVPVVAKGASGPTTKNSGFTAWKPALYGRYTVTAKGWVADATGQRYEGGGTFRFWIAKRMTLATATFQGMPYGVGSTYGREIQFNPPFPADVQVTATLYVNSSTSDTRTLTYSGKASSSGIFGAAQGMKPLVLSAPGEYHAQVLATYKDAEGHLWVSVMRHAGVVYAEGDRVIARGKKLSIGGKYVERGGTAFEGYVEPDGTSHLAHLTFPYAAGDVLLIGAEGQGANKIEPVLTYQPQGDTSAWDTKLNGVGTTNLRITTSNGYSPHLYPEYITGREYYYAAAPRPGFMGRFIVGESTVRAPYWPVSPHSFGSQIGASVNGDAPGDIYRLIGGVVLRPTTQGPAYSGYIASAFLLPKGSNNNRVVAAGSEDLNGPMGTRARFFLVGLRPGSAFEVGSAFRPALQIDPLLPVSITFNLTYPDGRTQSADGVSDRAGSFAGPATWPLDVPGVYRYRVIGRWNGYQGGMPGLANDEGEFYVYSKSRPAGTPGLRLEGPAQATFSPTTGVTLTGSSAARAVRYAVITPGAVIEQGELPVVGGRFQYRFSPATAHARVPLYDIVNNTTGKPQIGRVVHVTFFSKEETTAGTYFDFARVILRGAVALQPRTGIPVAASLDASARTTVATTSPATTAIVPASPREMRTWDGTVDAMLRTGELRVVRRDADTLVREVLHERLQQYHAGVPIYGAEVTRQMRRGSTVSIFGTLRSGTTLDTTPALDAAEARGVLEHRTGGALADGALPALAVLPRDTGDALVWLAEVTTAAGREMCAIDAADGELIARAAAGHDRELAGFAPADRRREVVTVLAFYGSAFNNYHVAATRQVYDSGASLQVIAHVMAHERARNGAPLVDRNEAHAIGEAFANVVATGVTGGELAGLDENGRAEIRKIFYRAFVYMLPSGADAPTARSATMQSARDLFGDDARIAKNVAAVWAALGF